MKNSAVVLLFTLSLIFTSSQAFSKGGDEVRNGGGLAEGFLSFAFENLSSSIDICLSKPDCAIESDNRIILKKIKEALPQEMQAKILKFDSEKANPGFFIVDGVVRMAVTGNKIGDPIYYNLDMLYVKNELRLTIGQATQSLIHELAHHLGYNDHISLDQLGAELRTFVEGSFDEATFLPHLHDIGFTAVATETQSFEKNGSLVLLFKDSSLDLGYLFKSVLSKCQNATSTVDPLKSSSYQFFNLHWDHKGKTGIRGEKVLSGNVILYCKHKYINEYRQFYKFQIGVNVNFDKSYFYLGHRLLGEPVYDFKIINNVISQ